ncbi:MAG: glucose-6-phosphate dehydrogenase assembly protein OpcA, partial [Actinobacteria bacterium]|nr:glucose-6-phosphate dehydrogenase assembly protein OpcA [Actinomycetota bacterium]
MAQTLTDTTLAAVERALSEEREEGAQRTSVMTHLVWAPPDWLKAAERTLAGLSERHPSRTVLLTPAPRRKDGIDAVVDVRRFRVKGSSRSIASEVVKLTLKGKRAKAPGSIAMPLLITDLPVFCRWRGEPAWDSAELDQLVTVVERLVVDSSEWKGLPGSYERLGELFDRVAVSDIAWTRTEGWRARVAALWPGLRRAELLEVTGPLPDALLLAGWLRSRLRRQVELVHRTGRTVRRVVVDGTEVEPPSGPAPSPSDLLSQQLDVFGRDPIYESAVNA